MSKIIDNVSTLEAAKDYVKNGLVVLPLLNHKLTGKVNEDDNPSQFKEIIDCNKKAAVEWGEIKSNTEDELEKWFNKNKNVAVKTGKVSNNLVVIDIDTHGSTVGLETLDKWIKEHGELPRTWTVKTGSGGRHYYYFLSDEQFYNPKNLFYSEKRKAAGNSTNGELKIDIRCDGGLIVAPPSVHGNGVKYEFIDKPNRIAKADDNVMGFLNYVAHRKVKTSNNKFLEDVKIIEGERNPTLFRYACKLQGEGLSDNEILLQVKKANSEHCTPPLDNPEILKIVESATKSNYLKGDKFTHKATQSNISPKVSKTQQRVNELKNMDAETRLRACKVYSIDEALSNFNNIEKLPSTIPTGFNNLDDKLYGGLLCGGLNIIGAVSSLGKTSFCLQMARNIAREHIPVLFVSIEQGVTELTSKLTTLTIMENNLEAQYSYTELMIKEFRKLRKDNEKYIKTLEKSTQILNKEIQNYLYLQQGTNRPTVAEIEVLVDTITEKHNRPPVVFIDYLQLLAQQNERDDEKRTVDKNITSLKQLANRINMPVMVISSLNRENYTGEMKTSAFKESGGIEYGADLLLGLQPQGIPNVKKTMKKMGEKDNAIQARIAEMYVDAKYNDGEPIELDLVILKNRNGIPVRDGISYIFDKRHSYFKEWTPPINDNEAELEDIDYF